VTAHAPPATIAQGGRRGPRILTMAYSVSPSGLMRWNVEITWRCSMGRVFDFNMSRHCARPAAALPCGRAGDPAAIAECADSDARWAIPDKRYTLHCLHLYVTSQFGHGLRFFRIPRYASRDRRGIPGARRSPYTTIMTTIYPYRYRDRAAGTRGHARTHR